MRKKSEASIFCSECNDIIDRRIRLLRRFNKKIGESKERNFLIDQLDYLKTGGGDLNRKSKRWVDT